MTLSQKSIHAHNYKKSSTFTSITGKLLGIITSTTDIHHNFEKLSIITKPTFV